MFVFAYFGWKLLTNMLIFLIIVLFQVTDIKLNKINILFCIWIGLGNHSVYVNKKYTYLIT